MIDYITDNINTDSANDIKDSNKQIGERVKKYTLVNNYFDNHLRVNKKIIVFDFVKYVFIYSFLITYLLNHFLLEISIKENIFLTLDEFSKIITYFSIEHFYNMAMKINEIVYEFVGIKLNLFGNYDISQNVLNLTLEIDIVMMIVSIIVLVYFLLIAYQYLAQKSLFNATFLQYYVPLWALYAYRFRDKRNYIFVKPIKHQKQTNIISSYAENILKNIFEIENLQLDVKDKLDIHLSPRTFLYVYDYYILTYTINKEKVTDKKTSSVTKEIQSRMDSLEENIDTDLTYLDDVEI